MIVMNNIDKLFDKPYMSAVAVGKFKRLWRGPILRVSDSLGSKHE